MINGHGVIRRSLEQNSKFREEVPDLQAKDIRIQFNVVHDKVTELTVDGEKINVRDSPFRLDLPEPADRRFGLVGYGGKVTFRNCEVIKGESNGRNIEVH